MLADFGGVSAYNIQWKQTPQAVAAYAQPGAYHAALTNVRRIRRPI